MAILNHCEPTWEPRVRGVCVSGNLAEEEERFLYSTGVRSAANAVGVPPSLPPSQRHNKIDSRPKEQQTRTMTELREGSFGARYSKLLPSVAWQIVLVSLASNCVLHMVVGWLYVRI